MKQEPQNITLTPQCDISHQHASVLIVLGIERLKVRIAVLMYKLYWLYVETKPQMRSVPN